MKSNKLKTFFSFTIVFLVMLLSGFSCFSQSTIMKCQTPSAYGLSNTEVNLSNSDLYCWEIRYLKEYHNILTMNINSYYQLFPDNISVNDIERLRKLGITPEKFDYLNKYFIDDSSSSNRSFNKVINSAIAKAKLEIQDKVPLLFGRPIFFIKGLFTSKTTGENLVSNAKSSSVYKPMFKMFGIDCINSFSNLSAFNIFPDALSPVGVVGRYIINAFGEIVGEIKEFNQNNISQNRVYVLGSSVHAGIWEDDSCRISNIGDEIKRTLSCTSCTMFEIAFNTVSRIGFVMYDKLSRYAIDFLVVIFSLWTLFMFFDNVLRKQDEYGYIKTFFTKSVWVVIVGAFLSVSITDENNIINYTVRPLTDFMMGYNKVMTKAIDKNDREWSCRYATTDISDNQVLFSKDVKQNIVCTIERIGDFNNLNIMIGKYQVIQGWRQLTNFDIFEGLVKVVLGISIMGMFFIFNITVPFFFIESLFKIAIVVFLFPLFLMGYAFDRGKSFLKQGLDTFLSSIFQIVSISIMCSVISLLMMYISTLDFYTFQSALENNNAQEMTSQILLMLSFNTNKLLEILYTGIICWYLMGQALTIANKFSGYASTETAPKKFFEWTKSMVKWSTSVVVEKVNLKLEAGAIANKLLKEKEKDQKQNKENKTEQKDNLSPEDKNV